jgi:hypothetical protein
MILQPPVAPLQWVADQLCPSSWAIRAYRLLLFAVKPAWFTP